MRNEGQSRKKYALAGRPPHLFYGYSNRKRPPAPLFEPYEEELPLESGYYAFVIDDEGRFRIERGNTSSHASLVGGSPVGAAGHFWIARSGKVGMVFCNSIDYRIFIRRNRLRTVSYVIDAFRRHQAFDVSPHAWFKFSRELADSFSVDLDQNIIRDEAERRKLIEYEGQGPPTGRLFSLAQSQEFLSYQPLPPPRLYHLKLDQLGFSNEIDDDTFDYGQANGPYGLADGPLTSGKKAFVLDEQGWLIIGFGHQLISGGKSVGAAGQIYVDSESVITEINLNFSGHYRPSMTLEYVHYTFKSLWRHPLLVISKDCRITARKVFRRGMSLETIVFEMDDLLAQDELKPLFDWYEDFDEDDDLGDGLNWS